MFCQLWFAMCVIVGGKRSQGFHAESGGGTFSARSAIGVQPFTPALLEGGLWPPLVAHASWHDAVHVLANLLACLLVWLFVC